MLYLDYIFFALVAASLAVETKIYNVIRLQINQMDRLAGDIIDGVYELTEKIGSGGMSVVWRARQLDDNETVVVKFPNWEFHEKGKVERGFEREKAALERLSDGVSLSSVVQLLDSGQSDDRYLVLEHIEGPTLHEALQSANFSFDESLIKAICRELCRAVDFLNSRGVLHLDIRPKNVLLRNRGLPVLIDFNTARMDSAPDTLFDGGQYKPPELLKSGLRDAEVGPRSDMYSLAMVISHLLSGNEPDLANISQSMASSTNIKHDSNLEKRLEMAVEADPEYRNTSISELLDSLSPSDNTPKYIRLRDKASSFKGCRVLDGDTVGRVNGAPSNLVVRDDDQFVSPVHFQINYGQEDVWIRDQSLNGTFIREKNDWVYLLSNSGQERRSQATNVSLPERTEERALVEVPVEIRPVDRDYGFKLCLEKDDISRSSA